MIYNPKDGTHSVASVCNADQVRVMNAINDAGLVNTTNQAPFLEPLDMSMTRIPLFINHLMFLLDSGGLSEFESALLDYLPPAPINGTASDVQPAFSYEVSPSRVVVRHPDQDGLTAETNHYVDPSWDVPENVRQSDGWKESEERRHNLLALAESHKGTIDADVMMAILDTPKSQGGATVDTTTYQVVAVPSQLKIWVNVPDYQKWVLVDLSPLPCFLIIVIMIYAGESVWKERRTKVSGIYDAMPTPDWLPLMSKLTSLVMVAVFMLLVCMISLMLFQVLKGYPNLEILLYFKGLFLHRLPGIVLLCILGIFLHVIAGNKYMGHMLIVAYMVTAVIMAKAFDMEHNLYRFGKVPAVQYSDMNGYGHFVEPLAWFYSYWGLFSILLMVLCLLLWGRGTENGYRNRLKNVSRRFTKPVAAVTRRCSAWVYYLRRVYLL